MATNIMFQGTGSSVGKSLLTAALCRILKEQGYKVAPFKSQNMALNSYITKEGKEMGRAQVVQAEAAEIEPEVYMNPILLKPSSDVGSQVILNGIAYKNMTASEYHEFKPELKELIKEAYNKLDSRFDTVVIEGAGSPAEINLRENDLVNMGMAEMVDAPVILIGDIDRGGVFASIYGTVMLMTPDERERIKGFIINKFRGDVEILKPGIRMIEEKINIPCLGVIPYTDINIDDEDSVTDRFKKSCNGSIVIGVIKLPHMSNFSDFTPLELEQDVTLKYISNKDELKDVDLIIVPGSKNTLVDLKHIYDKGIDVEIYRKHKLGIPIIGICGGYQMLGHEIIDPKAVESSLKRINGLSLLNTNTIIENIKQTKQVKGKINVNISFASDLEENDVFGYEIHMGKTEVLPDSCPAIELEDGRIDGAISKDGKVFGTYLHGIFDNDGFRRAILKGISNRKGLIYRDNELDYNEYNEKEYDKLARIVKESLDIKSIKNIMGL